MTTLAEREVRFWPKVGKRGPDECWPWLGAKGNHGYGSFWNGSWNEGAHRFSYRLLVGPIPHDLQIDHLCRNRACVNPAHMEPVTRAENILRGTSPTAVHAVKTHCPKGHPYDETNTHRDKKGRYCRACRRERERARYWRARQTEKGAL